MAGVTGLQGQVIHPKRVDTRSLTVHILAVESTRLERIGQMLKVCPRHLEQIYGSDLRGALLARKLPVMYLVLRYCSLFHHLLVTAVIFM